MVYYLNPKRQSEEAGSNYEVHTSECTHRPQDRSKLVYLGSFSSARDAIIYAKQTHITMAIDIDGCYFCCREQNKE